MYHPRSENTKWDTTEWDDIHRKLGNLPPCSEDLKTLEAIEQAELDVKMESQAAAAQEEKLEKVRQQSLKKLLSNCVFKAAKGELDFEDFEDEEEERFMEEYRYG